MRIVAFDVGRKRTGVAVSDPTGTLARPLACLEGAGVLDAAVALVAKLAAEEEGLGGIVVGRPTRLDGSDNDETPRALAFADELGRRCGLPVATQDERLTSIEAERRLAVRERDWRKRKARLDAAAAAVILQDYIDARAPAPDALEDDDDGSQG